MSEGYQTWIAYGVLAMFCFVVISVPIAYFWDQLDSNNFFEKKKNIDQDIQTDPMRKAFLYAENGNFGLAIDAYTDAISEQPNNENAWHQKGKLLNRLGQCSDALLHYERYADKYPNSERMSEGFAIAQSCSQ